MLTIETAKTFVRAVKFYQQRARARERARQYEFVRSTEALIMERVDGLLARLPSKAD